MNIIFDKNNPNYNNKNVIDTYIEAVENNHLLSNIVLRFMGVRINDYPQTLTMCFIRLKSSYGVGIQAYASGFGAHPAMSAVYIKTALKRVKAFMEQAEIIELIAF